MLCTLSPVFDASTGFSLFGGSPTASSSLVAGLGSGWDSTTGSSSTTNRSVLWDRVVKSCSKGLIWDVLLFYVLSNFVND